MALLINSMYSDEYKDDSYHRLQYLRLWQSLAEAGETCLSYQGNVRQDNAIVAGKKTLRELTEPASCITFLSEQAFAPQNTRFWSRSRVWFQFTVG